MPRRTPPPAAIPIDGAALRELRKRRNISIESLANRTEISASYLRYIETRDRNLSIETYHRLLKVLQLRYGALIREKTPAPAAAPADLAGVAA